MTMQCIALCSLYMNAVKALSKQEGPKIGWDACFLFLFWIWISYLLQKKKDSKNEHPNKSLVLFILLRLNYFNSISPCMSTENSIIIKVFSLSGIWDKRPHFFPRTNWSFSLLWLLKVDGHNYTPPW